MNGFQNIIAMGAMIVAAFGCAMMTQGHETSVAERTGQAEAVQPELRAIDTLLFETDRFPSEEFAYLGETFGVPNTRSQRHVG